MSPRKNKFGVAATSRIDKVIGLFCKRAGRTPFGRSRGTLQHTATHCNTLQHTAIHCNTLQHTATHCNTLQHTASTERELLRLPLWCIWKSHVTHLSMSHLRKESFHYLNMCILQMNFVLCRTRVDTPLRCIWRRHVTHLRMSRVMKTSRYSWHGCTLCMRYAPCRTRVNTPPPGRHVTPYRCRV